MDPGEFRDRSGLLETTRYASVDPCCFEAFLWIPIVVYDRRESRMNLEAKKSRMNLEVKSSTGYFLTGSRMNLT